eukprot:TRINITY_DN5994_c0_g1_i1.p1 TRINITY_DN5994_c0_g1~~TRINITY_DN5994_c0_g1_i1.p1  ORF type:complete len:481 (+),score=168.46 TRINITY_DN5994_c0_g1_i1:40-1482(+)
MRSRSRSREPRRRRSESPRGRRPRERSDSGRGRRRGRRSGSRGRGDSRRRRGRSSSSRGRRSPRRRSPRRSDSRDRRPHRRSDSRDRRPRLRSRSGSRGRRPSPKRSAPQRRATEPKQGCSGVVASWDAARGFGYVTEEASGERCFVHCSAFGGGELAVGAELSYDVEVGPDGRVRAANVSGPAVQARQPSPDAASRQQLPQAAEPSERVLKRQSLRADEVPGVWGRSPSPCREYQLLMAELRGGQGEGTPAGTGRADAGAVSGQRDGGLEESTSSSSDVSTSSAERRKKKKKKKKKMKKQLKKERKRERRRERKEGRCRDAAADEGGEPTTAQLVAAGNEHRWAAHAAADDDDVDVGPMPVDAGIAAVHSYGTNLLPGEGSAMARYVQDNKRIPRRGEIGMTAEEIESFESMGWEMSGSRHKRMNAVRERKEGQVIGAEGQRALAVLAKEERLQKESKVLQNLRNILSQKGVDVNDGGD